MNKEKNVFAEETAFSAAIEYPIEELDAMSETDLVPEKSTARKTNAEVTVPPTEMRPRRSRKKKPHRLKAVPMIVGFLLILAIGSYAYGVHYYTAHFLPATFVDGVPVGNLTAREAQEKIRERAAAVDSRFTVVGKNGVSEMIDISPAGVCRTYTNLERLLQEQDRFRFLQNMDEPKRKAGNFVMEIADAEALRKTLLSMDMLDPEKTSMPEDAFIYQDPKTGNYVIKPEIRGDRMDPEVFVSCVESAILQGYRQITFTEKDPEGVYLKPAVLRNDPGLLEQLKQLNALK